jgi:hypothetical protein
MTAMLNVFIVHFGFAVIVIALDLFLTFPTIVVCS